MSSNNPFASAIKELESFVHRREPPPVPGSRKSNSNTPPARPPKTDGPLPPAYEEVAGKEKTNREYPREKLGSSSTRHHSSSSRRHRSHSDSGSGKPSSRSRRERRHKSSKKEPEPVKAKNLDTIDKLDVTGFFGGGFHHDGPFDACTPHRNKNSKVAPVMAFPADGPNNSIKGSAGNVDKNEQMNLAFGKYDGGVDPMVGKASPSKRTGSDPQVAMIKTNRTDNDMTSTLFTPKTNPSVINFDANMKAEPIHGSTTAGLGSSTFIDGAPAPVIPSRENDQHLSVNGGGLSRKKSLVQRLRKNSASENNSRRNSADNESPEIRRDSLGGYDSENVEGSGNSLLRRVKSLKVGRK